MTAPGPDGQGSLARSFVTCLRFWDLTWPGCPAPDEARRGGVGTQVGSKNKQMQGETQHAREQKNSTCGAGRDCFPSRGHLI